MAVGIIYSANTGRIRWHTGPGHTDVPQLVRLAPGEALIEIDDRLYGDLFALQAVVTERTGLVPQNDRHVIIDAKGVIAGVVIADPAIDTVPGYTLVAHVEADLGWTTTADAAPADVTSLPVVAPTNQKPDGSFKPFDATQVLQGRTLYTFTPPVYVKPVKVAG